MSAIESDVFLSRPPQVVWRALTDSDLITRWLMTNDFAPIVGHLFSFETDPVPAMGFDGRIACEVLVVDEPRRLVISWKNGTLDTTVSWRLESEGSGTRLFLTHDGFDDTDAAQLATKKVLGGGWRGHLVRRLEGVLETM